jgi:hypothetical protein
MKNDGQNEVGRLYARAYTLHYKESNLRRAFALYKSILTDFPDTKEAGYANSQIEAIIKAMVPEAERLAVQMDLVAARFDAVESPDSENKDAISK